MRNALIISAILGSVLSSTSALSQNSHPRGPDADYGLYDRNHDGGLDFDEWNRFQWDHSNALVDADKDGAVSEQELVDRQCSGFASGDRRQFEACRHAAEARFKREAHGRSAITPAEFARDQRRFFQLNDRNRDGKVTAEERLRTARDAIRRR